MTKEQIAIICHEANKTYCEQLKDFSQMTWKDAPEWQRTSAIKGVEFAQNNSTALNSAQHDAWLKDKLENGWKYGPVKDPIKKEHPCCVSYDKLPIEQQRKDALFKAIVNALS